MDVDACIIGCHVLFNVVVILIGSGKDVVAAAVAGDVNVDAVDAFSFAVVAVGRYVVGRIRCVVGISNWSIAKSSS